MKNDYVLITPRGKPHKRKYARVFSKEDVTRAFNRGYDFIICEQTIELGSTDIITRDITLSKSVTITIHSNKPISMNSLTGSVSFGDHSISIANRPFLKDNKSI